MRYCVSCVLPDTRPGLKLGADGVCNACAHAAKKRTQIDWRQRRHEFRLLAEAAKARGARYDCVIPVSGGKDSHWQVISCLEYGLRPLAVTWRTPGRTRLGQRNLNNLIHLGVDHVDYSINPAVERTFARLSLEKKGTPAVPMHLAMFAIPMNLAVSFGIPLVVWGENSADEYGGDGRFSGAEISLAWMQQLMTSGTRIEDWVGAELDSGQLAAYFPPTADELAQRGVQAVFLGYFFPWDPDISRRVAAERGFQSRSAGALTGYYDYADLDDAYLAVHHWLKWYKFGITRTFDNVSLEIRNGRMSREEALAIIKQRGDETPREAIKLFCDYVGLPEERFTDIAESFRNRAIWKIVAGTWCMPKFLIKDWVWNESQREKTPAAV